jgi:hypothetical protein
MMRSTASASMTAAITRMRPWHRGHFKASTKNTRSNRSAHGIRTLPVTTMSDPRGALSRPPMLLQGSVEDRLFGLVALVGVAQVGAARVAGRARGGRGHAGGVVQFLGSPGGAERARRQAPMQSGLDATPDRDSTRVRVLAPAGIPSTGVPMQQSDLARDAGPPDRCGDEHAGLRVA